MRDSSASELDLETSPPSLALESQIRLSVNPDVFLHLSKPPGLTFAIWPTRYEAYKPNDPGIYYILNLLTAKLISLYSCKCPKSSETPMTVAEAVPIPLTETGLVKMEDRKRPAPYDPGDSAPPSKRVATAANGASKTNVDSDLPYKDELEVSLSPHSTLSQPDCPVLNSGSSVPGSA